MHWAMLEIRIIPISPLDSENELSRHISSCIFFFYNLYLQSTRKKIMQDEMCLENDFFCHDLRLWWLSKWPIWNIFEGSKKIFDRLFSSCFFSPFLLLLFLTTYIILKKCKIGLNTSAIMKNMNISRRSKQRSVRRKIMLKKRDKWEKTRKKKRWRFQKLLKRILSRFSFEVSRRNKESYLFEKGLSMKPIDGEISGERY